ncbi:MAG: CBS domain-containing protein, partial [Gammaproteobacteria bacterium]|nr:CBS domain-containing protein [Gammaproteobacteria bacterium]
SQVDVLRCKQDPSNNPKAVHAWEICNTRPEIAHFRDEVSEVVGRLLTTHVRCVVVVDDTGTIVGLVHHEDLLKGMLQQETDPAAITPERPSPAPTLAAGNEQN